MLYWAEGAKARNTIKFSNSDPQMVVFFRRFLTEALAVELDEIVMTLNVYTNNGMAIEEIERYWLDLLGLPDTRRSEAHAQPHAHLEQGPGEEQTALRGLHSSSGKHLDPPTHLRGHSGIRRF